MYPPHQETYRGWPTESRGTSSQFGATALGLAHVALLTATTWSGDVRRESDEVVRLRRMFCYFKGSTLDYCCCRSLMSAVLLWAHPANVNDDGGDNKAEQRYEACCSIEPLKLLAAALRPLPIPQLMMGFLFGCWYDRQQPDCRHGYGGGRKKKNQKHRCSGPSADVE